MRRFFVPPGSLDRRTVTIEGELHHHMIRVLRLKAGMPVLLADGEGHEARGTINQVGKENLTVALEGEALLAETGTGPAITLYQGLPKGDKLELILQKGTELGAAAIVPFQAARSVSRVSAAQSDNKLERWQRIADEAARQSQRASLPRISFAGSFGEMLRSATQPLKLLLWEEEQETLLRTVLAGRTAPESVAVIVGPEGGLSEEEARQARDNGFIPVSLGSRILRTETAGLAILSILQFHWGDLG